MLITIHSQATSEQRAQLMSLLRRLTGNQRPITPTTLDGRDIIGLDDSAFDEAMHTLLTEQRAVERILPIKTPYKLVNKAFKPEGSTVVVGEALDGNAVTIGGTSAPVINSCSLLLKLSKQLEQTSCGVGPSNRVLLLTSSRDLASKDCTCLPRPGLSADYP